MKLRGIFLFLFLGLAWPADAQNGSLVFRDVVLRIDTSEFSLVKDRVVYQDRAHLAFLFSDTDPVCEVNLYAARGTSLGELKLIPSGDFVLIDSLLLINNETARFKVRFNDLVNTIYLKFVFLTGDSLVRDSGPLELNLLPYSDTYLKFYPVSDELYIGEEKVFGLLTNNMENIQIETDWVEGASSLRTRNGSSLWVQVYASAFNSKQL